MTTFAVFSMTHRFSQSIPPRPLALRLLHLHTIVLGPCQLLHPRSERCGLVLRHCSAHTSCPSIHQQTTRPRGTLQVLMVQGSAVGVKTATRRVVHASTVTIVPAQIGLASPTIMPRQTAAVAVAVAVAVTTTTTVTTITLRHISTGHLAPWRSDSHVRAACH